MRPELSARDHGERNARVNREPNARVNHDEPIDWLAEFDSETEGDLEPEPEPEFEDVPHRSYADADLAMFPSEAIEQAQQPERQQPPLFQELPAGPPTGPQLRYGDYVGHPQPDSIDALLSGLDRAVNRLPQYKTAVVAQVRRRRAVFAATAAILVISTAATAGSLAMRRWQRSPQKTADQRRVETGSASAPSGGGLFGASVAAPAAPAVTDPAPVTNVAPPKPTPAVAPPAPLPKPTPKPTLTPTPSVAPTRTPTRDATGSTRTQTSPAPDKIAAVTSNPPPAAGNRPVTLGSSPAATPTPSPTPTPTPATPPRPTPAMSPEAVETAAIQGVIDRYRRTFDSLSVDDVAAFWPSVNVRSLSRAFDQLASQHLTFEGCSIDLRGHQADATCRGRVQFVPKVGSRTPRVENRQWTFLLLRADTAWTITKVNVK